MVILYLLLFFLGLFFGSFLNVIIDRLPRHETFISGRSHCDFCKHPLFWYDLIPLLSFVSLRGRCRYCKKFIGWKYPVIETTTAILFLLGGTYFLKESVSIVLLIYYFFSVSCLIVIFFIDLFEGIIPDMVLLPLGIFSLAFNLIFHMNQIHMYLLSALFAFIFFLFLTLITKGRGMGLGDVKFVFVMGLLLGWPGIFVGLYVAFLTGAI